MFNRKFRKKNEFSITHQFGFATIALVCFFTLYAPISILVFYSFNAGNNLMLWEGFHSLGMCRLVKMSWFKKLLFGQ